MEIHWHARPPWNANPEILTHSDVDRGKGLVPHVGEVGQDLAQQATADFAPDAQLASGVNAVLVRNDRIRKHLRCLQQQHGTLKFLGSGRVASVSAPS